MLHDHGHDYCNNDNNKPFVLVLLDQAGKRYISYVQKLGEEKNGLSDLTSHTSLPCTDTFCTWREKRDPGDGSALFDRQVCAPRPFFFCLGGS